MNSIRQAAGASRTSVAVMWLFALLFALFGTLTIQYAVAIVNQTMPWLHLLVEQIAPYHAGAEPGLNTIQQSMDYYHQYMGSMSTHAFVGGLVVMVGTLQFVPALRRNYRQLHRVNGVFMALFMTGVSLTGLYFLSQMPLKGIQAGESFYFALGAVALLSLGLLMQAGLAIAAKDFRAHMIWMGMAFACFLTAPLLRLNYIAVANFDEQFFNRVVQNSSPTILVQALVLMLLWVVAIGDRDLPTRPAKQGPTTPANLPEILTLLSIAGLAATSVMMVFQNLDNYFTEGHAWGVLYVLSVALIKTLQTWSSKDTWQRGMEGLGPTGGYSVATVLSSAALCAMAYNMNTELFYSHALFYSAIHLAIIELVILAIAWRSKPLSTGRNLFTLISASMAWFWLAIPIVAAVLLIAGFRMDMALTTAIGLVPSVFVIFAAVVGCGISIRFKPGAG